MTKKSNDKNYSLEQLKIWIEDAIHSEATPEEIYCCCIEAITDTLDKNRVYQRNSKELLSYFFGEDKPTSDLHEDFWDTIQPDEGYSSFEEQLEAEGYEYTPLPSDGKKKKKGKSHLKVVK